MFVLAALLKSDLACKETYFVFFHGCKETWVLSARGSKTHLASSLSFFVSCLIFFCTRYSARWSKTHLASREHVSQPAPQVLL